MNKLNLVISSIALILAGYLLFNNSYSQSQTVEAESNLSQEVDSGATALSGEGKIAYIDIDSINSNYTFLDDKLDLLRNEQSRSERRMNNKLKKAEEEFIKFQNDVKYMTASQQQQEEARLMQSQSDLQAYQEKLASDLMKLESSIQEELNTRIMDAVEGVNAQYGYDYVLAKSAGGGILIGKESYDITQEVLRSLNSTYASEISEDKEVEGDQ